MINKTIENLDLITAKASAYIPSLIILWASSLIIWIIVTLIFKSKNTNWGRFWVVWFFYAVISGIILIALVSSPNFLINIITKFNSFFA